MLIDYPETEISDEWHIRCGFWRKSLLHKPERKRRERRTAALTVSGQGLSISVNRGSLVVREGLTHHPQEKIEHRFFKGSLDLPPRIVLIDGAGSITLDALDWLSAEGVNLIRLKWDGRFVSAVTSSGQAADVEKLLWQKNTRDDPTARIEFARSLMVQKITNSQETLLQWVPSELSKKACDTMNALKRRISTCNHKGVTDILGLEGPSAGRYFNAWQSLELKWSGTKRHPIPDEWRVICSRAALRDEKPRNQSATHPINAMLNYVYGMLLARKQIEAIAEGYDPTVGIVHDRRTRDRGNTASFALDIMEPARPLADRAVIEIVRSHVFSPGDFTVSHKGTVKLNPELARLVAAKADAVIPASSVHSVVIGGP